MNIKSFCAALMLAFGLSACTTMGTNVSGKFRCGTADSVCAPSMVIDDSALARIEETSSGDLLNPAGPYRMDDGIDTPVREPQLASQPMMARAAPTYELSVVFPGYTDAAGSAHERRVVSIEAALPGRGDALETIAMRGTQPARSQGLLAAAESAPPYLAIAPGVSDAPAVALASGPGELQASSEPPQRTASAPSDPIADIEAEVAARLAQQRPARREAASFPSAPE